MSERVWWSLHSGCAGGAARAGVATGSSARACRAGCCASPGRARVTGSSSCPGRSAGSRARGCISVAFVLVLVFVSFAVFAFVAFVFVVILVFVVGARFGEQDYRIIGGWLRWSARIGFRQPKREQSNEAVFVDAFHRYFRIASVRFAGR
jgi:hypothetical protein